MMPDILHREVSAHPAEFRRGLNLAFPGRVEDVGDVLRVPAADGEDAALEIHLTVGAPRAIASIRLPTLFVAIRFTAGSEAARQRMLAHMDRAMHRGGG